LDNGFDGFIPKPIDSRELNHLLNKFILNKKPAEVIEAARLEQRKNKIKDANFSSLSQSPAQSDARAFEIEKFFIHDAENAIKVLGSLFSEGSDLDDEDYELFIITVHGMKSALANIGEKEMSDTAFNLEKAGETRDIDFMSGFTPEFIQRLKSLIEMFKQPENDAVTEINAEETSFLLHRLSSIKTACAAYDKKAAKTNLKELKQKTWPQNITNTLDEIAILLLHSEFKSVMIAAEELINSFDT